MPGHVKLVIRHWGVHVSKLSGVTQKFEDLLRAAQYLPEGDWLREAVSHVLRPSVDGRLLQDLMSDRLERARQ